MDKADWPRPAMVVSLLLSVQGRNVFMTTWPSRYFAVKEACSMYTTDSIEESRPPRMDTKIDHVLTILD